MVELKSGTDEGKKVIKKRNKKREPVRRPRGKRGGIKNRKVVDIKQKTKGQQKQETKTTKKHAEQIALFHTIEKKLAQTKDEKERVELLAQQEALGGLQAYQDASLFGADKQRGGETGKWCAQQLIEIRGKDPKLRLLDVGALSGTAYAKFPWIDSVSIDINPRNDHVLQYNFFDYPIPTKSSAPFDLVALSLVVNFVGDLEDRGRMLIHAHDYLSPKLEGYLFLVLPLACVQTSRYCTHDRLRAILASCGWADVVRQHDSTKLTHWLCKETSKGWDGKVWKKEEIKKGVKLNNFCITVK